MSDRASAAIPEGELLDRPILVSNIAGLLKVTRRNVSFKSAVRHYSGPGGSVLLDSEADDQVSRIVSKLIRHQNFEYLSPNDTRNALLDLAAAYQGRYRAGERPRIRELASAFIDKHARPALYARVYLGIQHLGLPSSIDVGFGRFLPTSDAVFLQSALGDTFNECSVYCAVDASGGTSPKLVDRAERKAILAISLLRFGIRRSSIDFHREQLLFDLHPMYAIQYDGGEPQLSARRRPQPIDLDLSTWSAEWIPDLEKEAGTIAVLPAPFRERIETGLEWMDIAARAPTWKTQIPAVFSAIESLLVPEDCGHKAEVVTVRAVILQVALGGSFFHPHDTYVAYLVRCHVVHGGVLNEDVTGDTQRLADRCEWWAREMITAYSTYASTTTARDATALVRGLDRSEAADNACKWFADYGADEIVDAYREAVGLPQFEKTSAN